MKINDDELMVLKQKVAYGSKNFTKHYLTSNKKLTNLKILQLKSFDLFQHNCRNIWDGNNIKLHRLFQFFSANKT